MIKITEQTADGARAMAPLSGLSFQLTPERKRQLGLIVLLAFAFGGIATAMIWLYKPPYRVLFSGLGESGNAQVMEALERLGVDFELDSRTGALRVPEDRLHQIRLKLAAEGLPESGAVGFELLDKETAFGTTEFMENARYQRALEGELARSISTIGSVQSARVHLAIARQSVFVRDRQPTSASIIVHLQPGRLLDRAQVAAIAHMVSSSVPNLSHKQVTVVDQKGNLLSEHDDQQRLGLSLDQLEYTRKIESHYIKRIEEILTPIVGPGRVRAQVAVDVDYSDVEQTEEIFDGDRDNPKVRSEQLLDERSTRGPAFGIPGALSNQPPAPSQLGEREGRDTAAEDDNAGNRRSESTRNFELDKRIRHTRRAPGSLRRVTAAVVIDDREVTGDNGDVTRQSMDAAELERLTGLVKEAIGFDDDRGDRVQVVNSAFAPSEFGNSFEAVPLWQQPWLHDLVRMGLVALLGLVVALMVLRPVLRSLLPKADQSESPGAGGAPQLANDADDDVRELTPMDGEVVEDVVRIGGATASGVPEPSESLANQISRVQELVADDPRRAVQVVKQWLTDDAAELERS